MSASLPLPDAEARAVSDALLQRIRARIDEAGGCLPFDSYMDAALYEPGLGYYTNGLIPFGEQGDFVTAPESGAVFGRCLARSIASVLAQIDEPVVMELGAGSGILAADLLEELEQLGALPRHYFILERSAAMRALQQRTLAARDARLRQRVTWLDELPAQPLAGVVFGNEVADALPVKRFRWRDGETGELGVSWQDNRLALCELPGDDVLRAYVDTVAQTCGWAGSYQSEYSPALAAWIRSLADCVTRGLLLLVDYGYARAEYYHAQRSMGTLMCHYRHRAHADPLWYPGLQDITAFVDFTAVAEAATETGMQLQGFTSQAQFLLGCGIDELMAQVDPGETRRFLQLSNEVKRLVLPGDMGDRFKVIGFTRNLEQVVRGFAAQDLRSRL